MNSLTDLYLEKHAIAPAALAVGMGASGLISGGIDAAFAPEGQKFDAFKSGFIAGAPWGLLPGVGGFLGGAGRGIARKAGVAGTAALAARSGKAALGKMTVKSGLKGAAIAGGVQLGLNTLLGGGGGGGATPPESGPPRYFNQSSTYGIPQYR